MNTNNPPFQKENLYVETDKNKKYYAVGFINKKDFILSKVFFIIYCFIVALSTYLAMDLKNIFILILSILLGFFLYLLFFIIKIKKDEKIFINFMNDLDFEKLETGVQEILNNDKIHPETKNYYLMQLVTYAPSYSKEKFIMYGNQVRIPKNKSYQINYDLLGFSNNMSLEELDQLCNYLLQKYKKNKRINKVVQLEYKIQKATMLGSSEEPIETLLQSVGNTNYQCAIRCYIYALYYANAHNRESFLHYYNEFIEKYSILKGFAEKLEGVKTEMEKL